VIPGFNALAQSVSAQVGTAQTITLTAKAFKDTATPTYKNRHCPCAWNAQRGE